MSTASRERNRCPGCRREIAVRAAPAPAGCSVVSILQLVSHRARMRPCSRLERIVPRRRPAQVRADLRALSVRHGATGQRRVSQLPGLSPRGRAILAFLEHDRLWPGQAEDALRLWRAYVRDPYHQRWDRPNDCGQWPCCPDIQEVQTVLELVAHCLPPRDARRFRRVLEAAGKSW